MFSIVFVPISQPCERPSRQVAAARRGLAAPRRGLAAGRRTVAAASSRHNRPPLRVAATIPVSPLARGVTSGINSLPTPIPIQVKVPRLSIRHIPFSSLLFFVARGSPF